MQEFYASGVAGRRPPVQPGALGQRYGASTGEVDLDSECEEFGIGCDDDLMYVLSAPRTGDATPVDCFSSMFCSRCLQRVRPGLSVSWRRCAPKRMRGADRRGRGANPGAGPIVASKSAHTRRKVARANRKRATYKEHLLDCG